ncbi:hypothetical protein CEXT_184161 [Caerostris extrusa]|uniref:Uncharacterized protein n=1 Tax=Caerostris extrusa TaxID=172846 RepID=A0AAV4RZL4_CAEEX|nr:hypothetical protein CEXT_184161 [Caerostris extrusa]
MPFCIVLFCNAETGPQPFEAKGPGRRVEKHPQGGRTRKGGRSSRDRPIVTRLGKKKFSSSSCSTGPLRPAPLTNWLVRICQELFTSADEEPRLARGLVPNFASLNYCKVTLNQ